jgi:hypothetical protein
MQSRKNPSTLPPLGNPLNREQNHHTRMNIKPIPLPATLVAQITTSTHIRWSDHQRTLLRTLLRFDNWTRPPHSVVAPIDVLRVFADSLQPVQHLRRDVRRTIHRVLRRWTVTVNINLEITVNE